MRESSEAEKEELLEEVRKEFPNDETMQQVHYVRLLHHRQTQGMSPADKLEFYARRAGNIRGRTAIGLDP